MISLYLKKYKLLVYLLFSFLYISMIFLFWKSRIIAQDFFPLYFGSKLNLSGISPYGEKATYLLSQSWPAPKPFPEAGIAYPLPFLILITPLCFLSYNISALIWSILLLYLSSYAIKIKSINFAIVILFWPFFWNIVLGQATLLWFGLSILTILGIRDKNPWMVGLCIPLLIMKPQTGLIFSLYAIIWALKNNSKAIIIALLEFIILFGFSYIIYPNWIIDWIDQISVYTNLIRPTYSFLWLILLTLSCWRLSWYARIAVLQVFLFPIVHQSYGLDPYTLLPLALIWIDIDSRISKWGILFSLTWPILIMTKLYSFVNDISLLIPLFIFSAYSSWAPLNKFMKTHNP